MRSEPHSLGNRAETGTPVAIFFHLDMPAIVADDHGAIRHIYDRNGVSPFRFSRNPDDAEYSVPGFWIEQNARETR